MRPIIVRMVLIASPGVGKLNNTRGGDHGQQTTDSTRVLTGVTSHSGPHNYVDMPVYSGGSQARRMGNRRQRGSTCHVTDGAGAGWWERTRWIASIWNRETAKKRPRLFYVARLRLIIDLGQSLFSQKSVNLIGAP
jgi:hypothetical protein